MALYFITGNRDKFSEVKAIIQAIEQIELDLPEIQELDPQKIIAEKLNAAIKVHSGEFIVEDTSLHLDCLNGLPGPFIKWFGKSLTNEELAGIAQSLGRTGATVSITIGYIDSEKNTHFFKEDLRGTIVPPRGTKDFAWGPIFQPEGSVKTFGEMEREEKHTISPRGAVARKLRDVLINKL